MVNSIASPHPASPHPQITREVCQLLAELDIGPQQMTRREGALVGVQVITEPQERDTFTLSVRVFPRQPEHEMSDEDMAESLSACQDALQDANWHIRVSALHMLSQLGGDSAVALIQQAQHDTEPYVHQAARQALAHLAVPRLPSGVFAGGGLVLYRRVDSVTYVWHQTTNPRGHALFPDLPAAGTYRLRWRTHICLPTPVSLPVQQAGLWGAPAPAIGQGMTLPQVVASTDDTLLCTVTTAPHAIELAFESQDKALQEAWVRFDLLYEDTGSVACSGIVLLHAVEGVYEGRYYLREVALEAPCTIAFGSLDPASLSAEEAQLIAASYEATDTPNRTAWRAWLQQRESELRSHPAWQAVYALLVEE
jgi:hypothetical protein